MVQDNLALTIGAVVKSLSTQTECARRVSWVDRPASLRHILLTKAIRHTPTWSLSQKSMGMKWHTMGWLSQSERLTSGRFSSSCTCRPVFVEIPAHRRVLRSDDGPLGSWPTAQGFPRLTIPPDRFIVFRIRAEQTGRDRGVCNHSPP